MRRVESDIVNQGGSASEADSLTVTPLTARLVKALYRFATIRTGRLTPTATLEKLDNFNQPVKLIIGDKEYWYFSQN